MILRQNFELSNPVNKKTGSIPPYVNKEGNAITPPVFTAIVDYLTYTFKPFIESRDLGVTNFQINNDVQRQEMDEHLADLSHYIPGLCFIHSDHGKHGYKYSYRLFRHDKPCGIAAYGGNNSTAMVQLTGGACALVDMAELRVFIQTLKSSKLTRVDLAHDDFEGHRTIDQWKQLAVEGAFAGLGRPPGYRFIINNDKGKGDTVYIGDKKNGKEACIYEKGKQLGNPESPHVRIEGRITSVDRRIPFEVLTSPHEFLAGLYEPFLFLSGIYAVINVVKNTIEQTVESLTRHARRTYGRFIGYLARQGVDPVQIVEALSRPSNPSRLQTAHGMGGFVI